LTIDQYNAFVAALPLIEAALAEKKVQVVRPDFGTDLSAAKTSKDTGAGDDEEEEQEDEAVDKVDDEEEE
jgi:hypothetical protein